VSRAENNYLLVILLAIVIAILIVYLLIPKWEFFSIGDKYVARGNRSTGEVYYWAGSWIKCK